MIEQQVNRREIRMKFIIRVFPVLLLSLGIISCSGISSSSFDANPEPVSIKKITPDGWFLDNGLEVIYHADPEVPTVRGAILFRGGHLWEPDGRLGATTAMGSQMRRGGAGSLNSETLDLELEKLAASVSSSFGAEVGEVAFSCLKSDIDRVFEIFSDVIQKPRFEDKQLQLYVDAKAERIKRRKDNATRVANISFRQLLYGNSPFGRVLKTQRVRKISRLELLRAHRELVIPNTATLIVTGDIDKKKLKELVNKHLAGWKKRQSIDRTPPDINFVPSPGIYFIELPFDQSSIFLGHQSVPRFTKDHIDIKVFNHIFGSSGLGSRMMRKLRAELGLTYGGYGGVYADLVKGVSTVFLQTKSDSTPDAIREAIKLVLEFQSKGPTEEEIQNAKRSIENSFVFEFDSIGAMLSRKVTQEIYGYPKNYDETYIDNIKSTNLNRVKEVANKRWDLSKLVVVVVGNTNAYNRVQEFVKDPSSILAGIPLKKVRFDEELLL